MFGDFATDRQESPVPFEIPARANPVVAAMASPDSLAENEPDLEDRVVIEVDTANPTPMTIAIAEAIVFLLTNANRFAEPEPAPKCRRRRQVPTSQTPAPSQPEPTLSHHARHCTICHHPERQAIDEEFIHWHSPKTIAADYAVGMRSVYRHARALGLFERRAANLREALGQIIERVENASITSNAVVHAVYAHAHLSPSGRWIEPPLVVPTNPSAPSELIDTPVE